MSELSRSAQADSDELYRTVFAAMSDGVILQDASSAVIACNPSAANMFGVREEDMPQSTHLWTGLRAIHPDGSQVAFDELPPIVTLRTGEPCRQVELGVEVPHRELFWVSMNTHPLFRPGEDKPYAVVSTLTDITERRRAEVGREQSEQRYRSIIETSLEGIWTIDLEGRTTFANARMARMLRCDLEELMRSSLWDFVLSGDRALVEQQLRQRAQGVGEEHEFRFVTKDGHEVNASVAACAIMLPDGRPGALAMVRDITEQKRLVDQLHEARRLEAVGRLAGGVAHDFNNLLTAILTSVELAERGDNLALHLETIRVASERAAGFTKQLLAFARKQLIRRQPLNLSALVRDFKSVLPRLVSEQIETVIDAPDTWPILGDRSQIEQVIVNLVANARDAMPNGGRVTVTTGQVTLDLATTAPDLPLGEYVVLKVRDTGGGIDESARAHIFEPFFSTKSHGTGMGLATCYGIVKQLGGHIRASCPPDGGTVFEAYFPRGTEAPPPCVRSDTQPSRPGHETVMIVEDDDLVCQALHRALLRAGYVVLAAADGEQALKLAAAHPSAIDLLVTDVVMPKLSGRQLAEQLTALRPELRVIFVSGYLDQIVLPETLSGMPIHFLAKPYTLDTLVRTVREVLDKAPT